MEFGSGIVSTEPPIDICLGVIAFPLQGFDLPAEGYLVGDTLFETAASQDAKLDLRHIKPAAVVGGMVELQSFHDAAGLGWGKRLI